MKIKSINQVSLFKNNNGIVITALGNDPSTLLPEFSSPPHGSIVVKIEIDSPRDTISQIFYTTTKKQSIFSEEMSKKRPVFGGLNKLYFQLPGEEISGPLRFDPGKKIGKYLLHSIEVRSIS